MTIANTLLTRKPELLAVEFDGQSFSRGRKFYRSLRSKGYIFIAMVLACMVLATLFFLSQREKPLQQLEKYHKIQQTQTALMQADIAASHAVTALSSHVTQSELQQIAGYFASLGQQYQKLALLFPEQAETFARLEQSIPLPLIQSDEVYRQRAHRHLAESKIEIERLITANQARLTIMIRDYRRSDDLLIIKSLVLGTGGLILIGAITTLFFNRLKADLLRLQQRTAEIVEGYHGAPLPVTRRDEVGQLIEGVNYMSQALANRKQALEIQRCKTSFREKMIAIDSLAGGIAHEVGNPITCIAGLAAEIAGDSQNCLSEQSKVMLAQLHQYTNGIIRITRDLSHLDASNIENSEWLDVNQLLTKAVKLCHYDNRWSNIEILLDLDPAVPAIYSCENQINQLSMHILENALDSLDGQADPRLRLNTRFDPERGIRIVFEDNGGGMDKSDLKHIFEPFFSTKAVGDGSGLGLAICLAIVQAHDGEIHAQSAPDGGFKIIIDLPLNKTMAEETGIS
jgi:signal transduction histidine kinase